MGSTIGEEAAAHAAMSQRHYDKVLHAMGSTIDTLADGCHMGIVAQGYSHPQSVAQHSSQWHNALPWHVARVLDTACQKIAAWCTDAH